MISKKRTSGRTPADGAGVAPDAAGAPGGAPAGARLPNDRLPNDRLPNDRLRWGLTGMAAIFLMVLVAAVLLKPTARVEPVQPEDSLATLGVAPGSGKDGSGKDGSGKDGSGKDGSGPDEAAPAPGQ
jgi:hypothetical protein